MDKNKQAELKKLVDRFVGNLKQYEDANYKEFRVRADFIDPFFELLDWDLANKQGFSEAYRDVIREDEVMVAGKQKAPDYCFKIGVEKKFFVEAKKPSVDIKKDIGAAYQLRRYAYSAKLPLSILTDFHEFAVYDTRIKPRPKDKADVARIFYCKFDEYEQKFDYIYETFSKSAILKGSFDRYVADTKKKKGTSEVDKEFLKLIEDWRNDLAKNIAINNLKLDLYSLNTAVQKIIDRIIFLRIAEARNIEPEDTLSNLAESTNIYKKLDVYFQQADKRYNSGLFKIESWLSGLKIDDKILKSIITSTYYPESPYEFSVLPVEILGNIYEQFLGKVIHLTATHQAKIEEKPEVKKAGGVYYTPQYIVDYIVKNTVGEKLKDSTPEKVEKLKICDPACGSGSFLLGAYAYLLRWHLDFYTKDKKSLEKFKKSGKIYDYKGDFKLTIDEKKKILKNNIFGVDIDGQAVEVTKLSLLLKLMEDETQQSAGMLIKYSKEALLPDLANNIKCGNSLIGSDFYASKNMSLFGNDEMRKVNAFDWETEFKEIFSNGGFDVVIGNPPWGAEIENDFRKYLSNKYPMVSDFESYQYFMIKSLDIIRKNGSFGMIIPNTFALNVMSKKCRDEVAKRSAIKEIFDLSEVQVFQDPKVRSLVLLLELNTNITANIIKASGEFNNSEIINKLNQEKFKDIETWKSFLSKETTLSRLVNQIILNSLKLNDYCEVKQGYIPYRTSTLTKRFGEKKAREIVTERAWHSDKKLSDEYFKELQGSDINRYKLEWSGTWIKYGEWVSTYLPIRVFSGPRIIIREITGKSPHNLLAAFAQDIYIHNPSNLAVLPLNIDIKKLKCILGILNSKLMGIIFSQLAPKSEKGLFPKIIITDAKRLPIPKLENKKIDNLFKLVDQMLEVQKKFHSAKTEADKKLYQQKIEILDGQIDGEVYKLYGLTEEEIKIVEGKFEEKK